MADRIIIYPGAIPLETDLLRSERNMMVALSGMAKALFGSSTIVNGLSCTPTSPASMQVAVGPGEIYSQANLDDTAFSSLSPDTVHQIMKQGIALDPINLSCPAPSTSGYSINYLIEAKFVETDTDAVTLPYYNASNPSTAYSGPANSGAAQPTARKGTISVLAKAGVAATTGSQTTPAADAGYTGLWVVTVANGASTITSGNITVLAGAPFVPTGGIVGSISATAYASRAEGYAGTATGKAVSPDVMAQAVQSGGFLYGAAGGTANALTVALTPAPAALVAGMEVLVNVASTNTGAATLNLNALGVKPIISTGAAISGGTLRAGQIYAFVYDGTSWQLQTPTLQGIVSYSLGVNGYEVWSHGTIEQWGETTVNSTSENTYPVSFPTPFLNAVWNVIGNGTIYNSTIYADLFVQPIKSTISLSGLYFQTQLSAGGNASGGIATIMWRAKGN